jgi:transposase-like protein
MMTDATVALFEYLRNIGLDSDKDFLREAMELLSQRLMELDVERRIGAGKHERREERSNQRNGYRQSRWDTRVGHIELHIPKLRQGSYYPWFMEPRRRAEKALLSVVQEAYVNGVSTRKVDDLVQAMGLTGIDKSKVSRICQELDELVETFRKRPLEGCYPYLWLDALYLKVRQNHRIVSQALVIAIGVSETGEREVLGFDIGNSESHAFWREFLRSLARRGLQGVQLAISDAHEGLKAAIGEVLANATWQRCRVHFARNLLAHVPKGDKALVAAAIRTIYAQPDRQAAGQQLAVVSQSLEPRWPKAAQLLEGAENDILAYMAFPKKHWTRLYSTNPLERLNKEVKRRTDVVGIFPNQPAVIRLVGTILMEISDEWQVGRRYFSLESMRELLDPDPLPSTAPEPLRLAPVR